MNAIRLPSGLKVGSQATVVAFTGKHPREDDLTVLVLRLPAA